MFKTEKKLEAMDSEELDDFMVEKEGNLDNFFVGRYDGASEEVKSLFTFAYCDAPLAMVELLSKSGKDLDLPKYLSQFSCADSALIHLVLLLHGSEKKEKLKAGVEDDETTAVSELSGESGEGEGDSGASEGGGNNAQEEGTKNKGGRPKFSSSIEKRWTDFENFAKEEMVRRMKIGETAAETTHPNEVKTWYDAAVEGINSKKKKPKATNANACATGEASGNGTARSQAPMEDLYDKMWHIGWSSAPFHVPV